MYQERRQLLQHLQSLADGGAAAAGSLAHIMDAWESTLAVSGGNIEADIDQLLADGQAVLEHFSGQEGITLLEHIQIASIDIFAPKDLALRLAIVMGVGLGDIPGGLQFLDGFQNGVGGDPRQPGQLLVGLPADAQGVSVSVH